MKIIPTRFHGILDYIYGPLLIASPWLFGFYRGGFESWVPITIGIIALIQTLLTDYEVSLTRVIPMPVHIICDIALGLFLALSPQVFNFWDYVWAPHVFLGAFAVISAALTKTVPADKRNDLRTQH